MCYAWKNMRGEDIQQSELFSYGSLEELVPEKPLPGVRAMNARFDEIYAEDGRRLIPPERLLPVIADALLDPQ